MLEMNRKQSTPEIFRPAACPADFLQISAERAAERLSTGEPDVYLAWGGEVYGPTGSSEVLAGLRASSFEEDATFWFEGQPDWLPVADFPAAITRARDDLEVGTSLPAVAATPQPSPAARKTRRRGGSRKGKPASRPKRGPRGLLIVFGFVLLAVGLTVGILLLLMLL
jgi:hypothetical protein